MNPPVLVSDLLRPRIKPQHAVYRTIDGNVRLGATVAGIGVEIEDAGGWVWTLLGALDGTRSLAEATATVISAHPTVTESEIVGATRQLLEAGFLEDADVAIPEQLPARHRERYSRGAALLNWIDRSPRRSPWDIQVGLSRSRVLLIGVGGVGGTVAQGLVASGVGQLHCVDDDTVELSNLNRQILYREDDLGRPKVDAALGHLRALNSDVGITGEQLRVGDTGDIIELLRPGYDLLVCGADQPRAIRRWANRACARAAVPWVTGGYHGPLVSACVHVPGRGACWECLHDQEVEQADTRLPAGVPQDGLQPRLPWNPANAVTAGITGNLVTYLALAVLTDAPPVEPGFRLGMNLAVPGESIIERYPPRPDCPICGDAAGPGDATA